MAVPRQSKRGLHSLELISIKPSQRIWSGQATFFGSPTPSLHLMTKSAERSIITHINENGNVVKIDSKIYSQGEGSDSPGGFRFKETARIN